MGGKKILILLVVVFLILAMVIALVIKTLLSQVGPVKLTYYGLWEPESVFSEVIADYKRAHPNITITYQKSSPINYRQRIDSSLAQDDSPDIVRIHNSWLPMLKNRLQPVPTSVYSPEMFKSTFYPVATKDFVAEGSVWAIPLEIDTLVLFVNDDILTAAGVSAPTTWEQFRNAASRLTVRDTSGRIQTAGAAIGAASNIDHWQDILSLMMLQAGVKLNSQVNTKDGADALTYFATFVSVDRVWDETLDPSTLAFASGKVAMYFAPSWRYFDIEDLKRTNNPSLKFRVVPVPQLTGAKTVNLASYWAEAISKKSKYPKEAAEFLKYLSSKEVMTKLYSAQSKIRPFGEPYSRVDSASLLSADANASVVISQAPSAESSYLVSATSDGDTGINSIVGKYFLDAVNSVIAGADAKGSLDTVASGLSQVLPRYGIVTK